ncbi:MAG: hypothetical protein ACK4N5_00395 [Myxococcales bacterium]
MPARARLLASALVACLLATLPVACGDDGITDDPAGTSGSDAGTGGGDETDAGDTWSGDGGTLSADGACATESAEAQFVTLPVDVIIAIDNSCSMLEETKQTNDNINNEFAQIMANSGLDYRVVMVSSRGTTNTSSNYPTCVRAPLGSATCGSECPATNCPRYKSVNQVVSSVNALDLLTRQSIYDQYKSFLRPDSQKYFLIITDDTSSISAAEFNRRLGLLTPPAGYPAQPFKDYVLHAIYGYESKSECPTLAAVGHPYTELVNATRGQRARVCDTDWRPIFNRMAQAVVAGSKLACEFNVPAPPPGKTLSASSVSVQYTPGNGGQTVVMTRVNGPSECPATATPMSFYFDNNTAPKKVHICPKTCPTLQNDEGGKVQVLFRCRSSIG